MSKTGDPVTQKMSIGCDATTRTASLGLGPEVGLDGHNEFEGDASLTRNDYFLANGDNFGFNSTLYSMMSNTCQGSFDQTCMKEYRFQRYQQSLADNGQFYFGREFQLCVAGTTSCAALLLTELRQTAKAVLLYGAASFLYQLFPSGGPTGPPNQANTNSFFSMCTLRRHPITKVITNIFHSGRANTATVVERKAPILLQHRARSV